MIIHYRLFTLAIIALGLSACSTLEPRKSQLIAPPIESKFSELGFTPPKPMARLRAKIESLQYALPLPTSAQTEAFAACMAPLTNHMKPAFSALLHQQGQNSLLTDQLAALDDNELHDHLNDIHTHLHSLVNKLFNNAPQAVARLAPKVELAKADVAEATKRSEQYLQAYFKKSLGQVISSVTEVKQNTIAQKSADKLAQKLVPKLQKIANKTADQAPGFIGREGTVYAFPGVTGDQANIDHSQIEADVVRIILEALRDTYAPLPILANTTGATFEGADILAFDATTPEASATVNWHVEHRDPNKVLTVRLTAEQFQQIEAKARSVESAVAGIVGKAIRGGTVAALNNEALAKVLETAAGVLARHTAERAQWCAQAHPAIQP